MRSNFTRKLVTLVLALALVFTSGAFAFADTGSPAAGKVSSVTSVATTTTLSLSWKAADNAKSYNIYLDGKLKKSGVTGTSYKITGLKAGSTHTIQIAGVNGSGKVGEKSSVTSFTKGNGSAALAKRWLKKTTITKATAGKRKVTVRWKKVKGATKYQVLQYKGGKWQVVATKGKGATKAVIKGLKKGTKYKFRVRALNSKGYVGIWSKVKTSKKVK